MSIMSAVWKHKGLWLIHVLANAALVALIYEWLWIPDRTVTHLLVSAMTGLAILALALWLHGGTLAHFRALHLGETPSWITTFKISPGKFAAFALWALVLGVAIWFTFRLGTYQEAASNWMSSFLTLRLRRPVTPASVASVFSWAITIAGFIVLPALLLPAGSHAAHEGFRGLSKGLTRSVGGSKRLRYWAGYLLLFILGALVPYWLVWWIPRASGFYAETASLAVRFLIAYLLAITSWLLIASLAGKRASLNRPKAQSI